MSLPNLLNTKVTAELLAQIIIQGSRMLAAANPDVEDIHEIDIKNVKLPVGFKRDWVPFLRLPNTHDRSFDVARYGRNLQLREPDKIYKDVNNYGYRITAFIAHHTVGANEHTTPPCTYCANGNGPLTTCHSVPGLWDGACMNCHAHGDGKSCSRSRNYEGTPRDRRKKRVREQQAVQVPAPPPSPATAGSRTLDDIVDTVSGTITIDLPAGESWDLFTTEGCKSLQTFLRDELALTVYRRQQKLSRNEDVIHDEIRYLQGWYNG